MVTSPKTVKVDPGCLIIITRRWRLVACIMVAHNTLKHPGIIQLHSNIKGVCSVRRGVKQLIMLSGIW